MVDDIWIVTSCFSFEYFIDEIFFDSVETLIEKRVDLSLFFRLPVLSGRYYAKEIIFS